MKFKVGDRVELIQATSCTNGFKVGEIYKITQIDCVGQYKIQIVNNENIYGYVDEEHIERVFTKSDLKDGDIVTYQDKTKAINTKNRLINECGSVCFLSDYNEDLTRKEENCKHLNIIKVERPTGYETVFKRKEDILNEAEKKYLSGVIRPFRNEVRGIIKEKLNDKNWISIDFKNDACMDFPNLKKKDDYKGMEVGKLYSLEELGL